MSALGTYSCGSNNKTEQQNEDVRRPNKRERETVKDDNLGELGSDEQCLRKENRDEEPEHRRLERERESGEKQTNWGPKRLNLLIYQ